MASPFNVFRRNQRVMMAALVGLSMFAFIFFDPSLMRSGSGVPKSLTVAMFAAICALGLWFVGRRHGKSSEWAMWGALLGGVAAFLFVRSAEPAKAVHLATGSLTEQTLSKQSQKRHLANQFVMRAVQQSQSKRQTQGFGPADTRSMVQYHLGKEEAKRLGISLNDEAVNRFISEITEDKLSPKDFQKILQETGVSAGDLFNILRGELESRLAFEMQAPPYDLWTDFSPQTFQMFLQPKLPATPEEQWEFFLKLHEKESLAAVAVPVDAFLAKVPEPTEVELKELFDQRKSFLPSEQGDPGFIQPHRVKLAYLAADFEKFESQVPAPTDEEIEAYYQANKENFRIRDIHSFPDVDPDEPADADQPMNVAPPLPDLDAPPEKKETEENEKSDAKPEEAKPDEPKPEEKPESKDERKKDDKPAEEKSSQTSSQSVFRLVSAQKEENAAAETKSEEAKPDEKPAEKPAAEDQPVDAQVTPEADMELDDFSDLDLPMPGEAKSPQKYRELDEELRDEIKEIILKDRAFEKMGTVVDEAQRKMETLATTYIDTPEADRAKVAEGFVAQLKEYAEKRGLLYVETPLLSQAELLTSPSESIGTAVLSTGGGLQFQARSVLEELFPPSGQAGPLYYPQRADSRTRDKRYSWWKIEDVAQHVPKWDDKGIRELVLSGWKSVKARQLAEQRAEQLAALAQAKPGEALAAAFSGQTVTGDAAGDAVVVRETPRFSWLTTSGSVPNDPDLSGFMAPRRSIITGVQQAGDDFMKTVFEQLKNNEVGVAPNSDRSVYYVVQVRDRDGTEPPPTDVEGFQTTDDLRKQFLSTLNADQGLAARPYNIMMFNNFRRVQQDWQRAFDQRYGVEMDELLDNREQ